MNQEKKKMGYHFAVMLVFIMLGVITLPYTKAEAGDLPLKMSREEAVLTAGDSIELSVNHLSKGSIVTWSSSNTSAATVKEGIVTAKKSGKAMITAEMKSGMKKEKVVCEVTVVRQQGNIKMPVTIKDISYIKKSKGQEAFFLYPKVTVKGDKEVSKTISLLLKREMKANEKEFLALQKESEDSNGLTMQANYELAYHQGNLLCIVLNKTYLFEGADGREETKASMYIFDLRTGKLAKGLETAEVDLKGNAGTGYEWSYTADPKDVLELKERKITGEYENLPQAPAGGRQTTHFEFAAGKSKGAVTLTFEYKRSWEKKEALKKAIYRYYVDDTKRIYLISAENE